MGKLIEWLKKMKGVNGARAYPYSRDCHMLPQAAFVHGWDPETLQVVASKKSCQHVLRFESLTKDFNELMESRGFPYRLTHKKSMPSLASCAVLKRAALYNQTKELILELYKRDFDLLGYTPD